MHKDDEIRIRHMLDAAREAESFAAGRTRRDLDTDRQLVLSLVKEIEIVGEAATQITEVTREQWPSIPWDAIIGMRHRLVHAYFSINMDIVWHTVQEELPRLIALLDPLVPPEPHVPPSSK